MTYLKDRLDEIINTPYEILHHRAALRPTVKDRRMIIGQSPLDDRLYIFNGLGTKGASLAPLGSKWLAELVSGGMRPPAEVDYAPVSASIRSGLTGWSERKTPRLHCCGRGVLSGRARRVG